MSALAHIHLGPGKVGLGCVVATTRKAGMDVHVVARPGSRLDRARLSVIHYGDHGQAYPAEPLVVQTLSCVSRCSELDVAASAAIADAPGLLVTTTLGCAGLRDRAELIGELIARRPAELRSETVFMPVELEPGQRWAELERDLRKFGVECRDSMVDGLFSALGGGAAAAREIHAAPDAEWLIEDEPNNAVLRALSGVPGVRMVPDIDCYRERRRWLVDSGILAAAIRARDERRPALVKDFDQGQLADFYAPAVRAFDRRHAGDDLDARAYADDNVQMAIQHGFDASTALDGLRRVDPLPFLKEVDRALVEPFAAITADGDTWPGAAEAMEALHRVLANADQYSDYEDIAAGRMTISERLDDEAAELYGEIIGRVYSGPETVKKTRELVRSLKDHRDEHAGS